ncbi:MAG: DUF2804 family protein [Microthrixaceae bacterium]|nr:DUF2804 family protein [Microthrixaceae bacterium]
MDYLGIASIWWADLSTGATGGHEATTPLAQGVSLPDRPGTQPLTHRGRHSKIDITDDDRGTTITARWTERDGRAGELEALVELPEGHESLNVVIPWSRRRFQYTSKHQARPASGTLAWATTCAASDGRPVTDPRSRPGACWMWVEGVGRIRRAGTGEVVPATP